MENPALLPFADVAAQRPVPCGPVRVEALWVAGNLAGLRLPVIAIVGTRAATPYGRGLARRFAAELGRAGCCILSGLALGIDAAAHEGALEAAAPTIGVLGGGHRRFFPRRNRDLADRMIAAGGGVISPFGPDGDPAPHHFLQRNAVVAALADALIVVEAPARSGALNTAGWAAGRIPVFAVPGDVDRPHVAGCHALIRDGATLARDARDVLADLRIAHAIPQERAAVAAPQDPLGVLRALSAGERTLDDIVRDLGEPAPRVLSALSMLELQGAIEARPGNRYARR
jgi:DNA processing protein